MIWLFLRYEGKVKEKNSLRYLSFNYGERSGKKKVTLFHRSTPSKSMSQSTFVVSQGSWGLCFNPVAWIQLYFSPYALTLIALPQIFVWEHGHLDSFSFFTCLIIKMYTSLTNLLVLLAGPFGFSSSTGFRNSFGGENFIHLSYGFLPLL